MSPRPAVDAILLAAGASRRFGSDKRLLPINGVPMLQCSLAALLPIARQVLVVLREGDQRQQDVLLGKWQQHPAVTCLYLDHPGSGMGSNLARAVAALPTDCCGVLVALGDMPFLRTESVKVVVDAFEPGKIIIPVHGGRRGHPVLFPAACFSRLANLAGDVGARSVLDACEEDQVRVLVDDPGILTDIDLPGDVAGYLQGDQQAR